MAVQVGKPLASQTSTTACVTYRLRHQMLKKIATKVTGMYGVSTAGTSVLIGWSLMVVVVTQVTLTISISLNSDQKRVPYVGLFLYVAVTSGCHGNACPLYSIVESSRQTDTWWVFKITTVFVYWWYGWGGWSFPDSSFYITLVALLFSCAKCCVRSTFGYG